MRLFIGLDLPQGIKDYLKIALLPLQVSSKSWENSHDYHVTLHFIGETNESIESVMKRMKSIPFHPFELTLGPLEFFPRRVMYLSVNHSPDIIKLRESLYSEFSEYIDLHARPFLPHITVKRWQRHEFDELKKRVDANPIKPQTFWVKGLTLFRAEKDSENRKYHPISDRDQNGCLP
ncbi:MAG TPA: RNA 2',3'-cyclic phosphodiesterase [Bacteriovoracaceae bacterium]|nr:RNA 2',3'-cyclic phosphodiesterase [Bacteriovoracaceae bacterium]